MRNLFGCFTHKSWEEAGADDDNKQKKETLAQKALHCASKASLWGLMGGIKTIEEEENKGTKDFDILKTQFDQRVRNVRMYG